MEIIIGSMPALQQQTARQLPRIGEPIPGQLLNVRPPRKGIAGPSGRERRNKSGKDPIGGRVLTIMVPDAKQLPADIDSANYEISLRLIRK